MGWSFTRGTNVLEHQSIMKVNPFHGIDSNGVGTFIRGTNVLEHQLSWKWINSNKYTRMGWSFTRATSSIEHQLIMKVNPFPWNRLERGSLLLRVLMYSSISWSLKGIHSMDYTGKGESFTRGTNVLEHQLIIKWIHSMEQTKKGWVGEGEGAFH